MEYCETEYNYSIQQNSLITDNLNILFTITLTNLSTMLP